MKIFGFLGWKSVKWGFPQCWVSLVGKDGALTLLLPLIDLLFPCLFDVTAGMSG